LKIDAQPLVLNSGSNANVGIGTTSPSYNLHVSAASGYTQLAVQNVAGTMDTGIIIQDSNRSWKMGINIASLAGAGSFNIFDVTGSVDRLVINASGYVGIGTVAPGNKFVVASAVQYNGIVLHNGVNTVAELIGSTASNDSGLFDLYTGGTLKVRIAADPGFANFINNGNSFGLGTASPQAKLHVVTTSISAPPAAGTYGGAAIFGNDQYTYGVYIGAYSNGNGYIQAQRGDSATVYPLLLQPNSGSVGIGKTAPAYALDVTGDVNCTGAFRINGTAIGGGGGSPPGGANTQMQYNAAGAFGGIAGITYASGSNLTYTGGSTTAHVGVATAANDIITGSALGDTVISTNVASGNGIVFATGSKMMNLSGAGNLSIGYTLPNAGGSLITLAADSAAKPSTNYWQISSDIRLKKNVRPYELGLAAVRKVDPIRFQYNGLADMPTEDSCVGVDAAKMQPVFPESVGSFISKDGTFLHYNPQLLFYAMLNAIKELADRLEKLEGNLTVN
jgi:hypothetical protein